MFNIKQQNELFCTAKNSWMRPEARHIECTNARTHFYGKKKVDRYKSNTDVTIFTPKQTDKNKNKPVQVKSNLKLPLISSSSQWLHIRGVTLHVFIIYRYFWKFKQ